MIRAVLEEVGGLAAALAAADPVLRAQLYKELGIEGTYDPGVRTVEIRADLRRRAESTVVRLVGSMLLSGLGQPFVLCRCGPVGDAKARAASGCGCGACISSSRWGDALGARHWDPWLTHGRVRDG